MLCLRAPRSSRRRPRRFIRAWRLTPPAICSGARDYSACRCYLAIFEVDRRISLLDCSTRPNWLARWFAGNFWRGTRLSQMPETGSTGRPRVTRLARRTLRVRVYGCSRSLQVIAGRAGSPAGRGREDFSIRAGCTAVGMKGCGTPSSPLAATPLPGPFPVLWQSHTGSGGLTTSQWARPAVILPL